MDRCKFQGEKAAQRLHATKQTRNQAHNPTTTTTNTTITNTTNFWSMRLNSNRLGNSGNAISLCCPQRQQTKPMKRYTLYRHICLCISYMNKNMYKYRNVLCFLLCVCVCVCVDLSISTYIESVFWSWNNNLQQTIFIILFTHFFSWVFLIFLLDHWFIVED
jgi:hypothetical protein